MIFPPMIRPLILLMALAASAAAQKSPDYFPFAFGPIGIERAMSEVGISEAQMRQVNEIFQGNRNALKDLRIELEKAERDLHVALDQPHVDLARTEPLVNNVLEARGRLAKHTTLMMVRMRQVLTQEQWRKLREIAPPPPPPPAPPAAARPPDGARTPAAPRPPASAYPPAPASPPPRPPE